MNPATSESNLLAPRPLRDDVMTLDPPRLIGSRCGHCGSVAFPARPFCPACGVDDHLATVPLSGTGTVFSFTVVRQAPPGRATPYVLAYVDLPEQVCVMAQVDHAPEQMRIGLPVRIDFRTVRHLDGPDVIGYVFVADNTRSH